MLTPVELNQYAQHIGLEQVGKTGQLALKQSRILCIGVGGLGAPVCLYLASAGVGCLGLVDGDHIARSNLPRQILYTPVDLGEAKVTVAANRLKQSNPDCEIHPYPIYLTQENALSMISQYDLVIDCSDNFATRYLVNDACCHLDKVCISASLSQFNGMLGIFSNHSGCYRCLFNTVSNLMCTSCQDGVLNTFVGWVALLQAHQAIRVQLGLADLTQDNIIKIGGSPVQLQRLTLHKDPNCPACGHKIAFSQLERPMFEQPRSIDYLTYQQMQQANLKLSLVDVRTEEEYQHYHLDNAMNVPLDQIPDHFPISDKDTQIVLYCHLGRRSLLAREQLIAAGYTQVWDIAGGLEGISE